MSQKKNKENKKREKKRTSVSVSYRSQGSLSGRARNAKRLKNRKALLMDLVSSKNYQPMRQKDIAMLLQVPSNQRQELAEVLNLLVQEGKIDIISEGRYQKSRGVGEVKERRSLPQQAAYDGRREGRTGRGSDKKEHQDGERKPRIQTVDIPAVIEAYQLPTEFPPRVLMQAERCPETVIPNDLNGRMDLREWQMVTIDGEDAKDLDDAVSVTREGMYFQLGVHIADVSNYVQADSALDREALRRGTSVYLPDRVIPMLPKRLSNGICSLNEGEDRLALSCIMTIDGNGRVVSHRIAETVICVDRRMTYTAVNAILTEPENHPDLMEKYEELVPMFQRMQELSDMLRRNRQQRGAIDFEFPESKVILNEDGVPIDIRPYPSNAATRMIEDFMLMANETVAMEYCTREIPFLYRTHDQPDRDRMESTLQFIREQGILAEKRSSEITPAEVQKILSQIEGSPGEPLISRLLLRSMSRAVYTPKCSGHFGLAAKYYCHFTSPIRRYPDLQIHRIIKDDLRGRLEKGGRIEKYASVLPHVAEQSSMTEQRAAEAERESVKLKKAEYMLERVGEEFDGVISGVTGWGIYVELPNTVEGLVHIITLRDDFYRYDEENYQLVGEKSGKSYRLGQPVRIRVRGAEPANRTIDFELVSA
ncbi:MAG: ribonuclease R [Fusicatenibacter sp.]|nr:ribonuclease R [Fusicatenibacter sp.]